MGKITNVAGLDLKIQKPLNSDLHITDCNSINTKKINSELGWYPKTSFEVGIKKTVVVKRIQWVKRSATPLVCTI